MSSLKERRWIRFCGNKSFSYNKLQRLSFCCSLKARDWRSLSAPMKSARREIMKLLLTSAGIKNTSIHNVLVDLLGKPIADSSAFVSPLRGTGTPRSLLAMHGGSSADENPTA